jgi:glycine hydroxymethyltransferase
MIIDEKHGGYDGYMPGYMPKILNLQVQSLPFIEQDWNLDHEKAVDAIRENKPKLVILGASFILFPYNLKPIREVCNETGSILGYDASHVLGLIAGSEFQKPLDDGVDIVIGSTHKTLFGPQGGLILTNHEDIFEKVSNKLSWHTIDNAHQNRIAGLGQALLEMDEFGSEYAKQVVKNSKALAHALSDSGFPVKFEHLDFTQSHQTLLDVNLIKSELGLSSVDFMNLLEDENVIIDAVGRLGANEMTRRGCKEDDIVKIAEFIERIIIRKEKNVKNEIKEFLNKFDLEYCF